MNTGTGEQAQLLAGPELELDAPQARLAPQARSCFRFLVQVGEQCWIVAGIGRCPPDQGMCDSVLCSEENTGFIDPGYPMPRED